MNPGNYLKRQLPFKTNDMGKYMSVVLKQPFQADEFIKRLNKDLLSYGAPERQRFNPWYFLREEADFMNTETEGLKQLPHWRRPITPEQLSENFFWLRHGEFSMKLSGSPTPEEAREAIAVSKWIAATKEEFIHTLYSENYERPVLSRYLNDILTGEGLDLSEVWK